MTDTVENLKTFSEALSRNSAKIDSIMAGVDNLMGGPEGKGAVPEAVRAIKATAENLDKKIDWPGRRWTAHAQYDRSRGEELRREPARASSSAAASRRPTALDANVGHAATPRAVILAHRDKLYASITTEQDRAWVIPACGLAAFCAIRYLRPIDKISLQRK